MKVLHVIPSLSRVHGGPTAALEIMERALRAEGIHVETATTDDDGPGRRLERPLGRAIDENGDTRWYFRKDSDFYTCSWTFARWIDAHVRDFDLIHVHALFSFTSTAAARAARRRRVPYVVRPLGVLNEYGVRQRRPLLKRLSLRLVEGPILRHAAAVHFTSEAEQREAQALGVPMQAALVPLAVQIPDLAAARRVGVLLPKVADRRVILFLSRLDPKKNLEGLLRAYAQERVHLPGTVLVIAGAGDTAYSQRLKETASALGIADHVLWLGHVGGELKASLLRDAAVFVLPSFSENFGIAAAEALAAGLPCVLGHGVALAEAAARAGAAVCVEPDAAAIAGGLRQVLGSQPVLAEMAGKARLHAATEFSAELMGRRLRQLYKRILHRPRP